MCGGDFMEVYRTPDQARRFDCIATCFFIDTAHNVIEYLEVIHHALEVRACVTSVRRCHPQGRIINFGRHWEAHTACKTRVVWKSSTTRLKVQALCYNDVIH
jgi:hypothetical protein